MQKRFVNPTYSYIKGGAATISCTLEVLDDTGEVILASTGLSYVADLTRADFRDMVTAELARQAQEYIDQLKTVAGLVYAQFSTPDFTAAIGLLMTDADALVEV